MTEQIVRAARQRAGNAVDRVLDHMGEAIMTGALMPGEHILQEHLAERMGVSRVPVREALKVLSARGLVSYEPNRGYFVPKMSASDMDQVYMMRRLLERELIKSLEWPPPEVLGSIEGLNRKIDEAVKQGLILDIIALNRQFHFSIFALSPLKVLFAEVQRLWAISDIYRAVYLYSEESRRKIVEDHNKLLAAIQAQDVEECIKVMDRHRSAAEVSVTAAIAGRMQARQGA